jgi:hypothetical protein
VLSRVAGLGLATAIIAGTTVGLVAPAEAAAKAKCTTGTWKLISEKGLTQGKDKNGKKFKIAFKGGAGIKVRFGGTKAVYTFTGSKKETQTGYDATGTINTSTRYTGSLKVTVKLSGNKNGIFTVKNKTAQGNAVAHLSDGTSYDVDKVLHKKAGSETLIAAGNVAGFACDGNLLVMYSEFSAKNVSSHTTLTYRRV